MAVLRVQMLVGALVDSWDRMREGAMGTLLHFPAPLPGLSDGASVERLIRWGAKLLESPRSASPPPTKIRMKL
jgi:hypothetical protein